MTAIVVGTDGSEGGMAAVIKAGRLAAATGGRVIVVSAYDDPETTALPAHDMERRATEALRDARRRLEADGVAHETRAVLGTAVQALCDVAAIESAGTIVVGSRGPRRILGWVPHAVTHRSPCDVLVVRTD